MVVSPFLLSGQPLASCARGLLNKNADTETDAELAYPALQTLRRSFGQVIVMALLGAVHLSRGFENWTVAIHSRALARPSLRCLLC